MHADEKSIMKFGLAHKENNLRSFVILFATREMVRYWDELKIDTKQSCNMSYEKVEVTFGTL